MSFKWPFIGKENVFKQVWRGLDGAAIYLAIAEFVRLNVDVHVLVCESEASAVKCYDAIKFLLKDSQIECLLFPDWETLPYDRFSPHQDLVSARLFSLSRLMQSTHLLFITTINTAMRYLCPPSFIVDRVWMLAQGQSFKFNDLRLELERVGYHCTPRVMERGEFAVRGCIIDVFPMGSKHAYRIEVFDDQIESLRTFDPETQISQENLSEIKLLPAKEIPVDDKARDLFRKQYREQFPDNVGQSVIYSSVSDGKYISGIEYYAPLFFEKMASLLNYIPAKSRIFMLNDIVAEGLKFEHEINVRYDTYRHDISHPILPPDKLFMSMDKLKEEISLRPNITIDLFENSTSDKYTAVLPLDFATKIGPNLLIERKGDPLINIKQYISNKLQNTHDVVASSKEAKQSSSLDVASLSLAKKDHEDTRILFIVESLGRKEVLLQILKPLDIHLQIMSSWQEWLNSGATYAILIAPFDVGVEWPDFNVNIISESQLFGMQAVPQRKKKQKSIDPDLLIRDLVELKVNALVVHVEYGIGRYLGLKTIEINKVEQEYLELLYAAGDKIYVPVTSLNCITRYTGVDVEHVSLHKLGTDTWQKEKKKAQDKIYDVAVELLESYAKRKSKPGLSMELNETEYAQFVSSFPFEETEDQEKSITAILKDLNLATPMDRLICGDVGFGKTEVAMRAAFVAAQNGKQVCILVPTTLLAGQHFTNFCDRFAEFPVQIGVLSRFRSKKEAKSVLDGLENGSIDIVIGTHKLLMQDLRFKNLGLIIVDEEHRFGVRQKEKLKAIRHEVHCLTMTATPIPRTLNMAMLGMRDISLMTTPPLKRLAIKTFWRETNKPMIREAILREILRGGQVFYLHNEVSTIENTARTLQEILPEAKVKYAHGQMPERQLEYLMLDFYHQRFNVLVCTTIIETGIDIPTANTIIIERADLFGLAQLHQLRGRVGRSHHQAYAYLLTPPQPNMTKDAVKRLEAIVALEDLGSGFLLASQDLEIRGAGELLGEEQSGNMHQIGFQLYMEMLDQAVKNLKEHKNKDIFKPLDKGCEVELSFSALIPETYVFDVNERLILYKRIASAQNESELQTLAVELIDRFGLLPQETKNLLQITEMKLNATPLGINKIIITKGEGQLHFNTSPKINSLKLIQLIQKEADKYRMQGPSRLKFYIEEETPALQIKAVGLLINMLEEKSA